MPRPKALPKAVRATGLGTSPVSGVGMPKNGVQSGASQKATASGAAIRAGVHGPIRAPVIRSTNRPQPPPRSSAANGARSTIMAAYRISSTHRNHRWVSGKLPTVIAGGGGPSVGITPPLRIAAIQISTATNDAKIGAHRTNSGPAMRLRRSLIKPGVPRRFSIICANRPAIRKKLVIRNRWMAKNRTLATGELSVSGTIQIVTGK